MTCVTIDTRGLSCPLPLLKVQKEMRKLAPGTLVRILATDPLAEEDVRAYCQVSGCAFLSAGLAADGALSIEIRKP